VNDAANFSLLHKLEGHSGAIYSLCAFGDYVYSGGADGMIGVWDATTFLPAPLSIKVGKAIFSLYVGQERILIGESEGAIHVVDRVARQEIRHLKYHSKGVFDLVQHGAGGHFLATGGDGVLSVFSDLDYRLQLSLKLSDGKLRRLAIHPDGLFLAASASDGKIRVLETEYFNELVSIEAHLGGAYGLVWLDSETLISTGRDAHIRVWKWANVELAEVSAIPAHNYAIYDLIDLGKGTFATASRDKTVKIWDRSNFDAPHRLLDPSAKGHLRSVNALCAIGDRIWSACDDGIVRVWGSA